MTPASPESRSRAVFKLVRQQIERLLFVPTCGGCGWPGSWWCPRCRASLASVQLGGLRCWRCDLPLDTEHRCRDCSTWPSVIGAVRALYAYDGVIRSALHRVKYRAERRRGEVLAAELAAVAPHLLARWRDDVRCVVPVPLHPSRLHERGFNQSSLLARAVGEALERPVREELVRVRVTPAQVGRSRSERWQNVDGAFRWVGAPIDGTVVLVDDVVTTGATISAAAQALAEAGAQSVVVCALARARLD